MRIQHNIAAMNAYRNYNTNTSAVSKNLEKLSSGYKINRAGDDAAGLAISEKMRAQISGLNAASKNVKDGISLVKTAEGAMQEVQDMLNRMVTLATQSANGTYDNEVDRMNLQKEVDQLRSEINRIADSSNFNGIKLMDGSQEIKTTYNVSSPSDGNELGFKIISDGQLGVDAQAGVFSYDLSQLSITVTEDMVKNAAGTSNSNLAVTAGFGTGNGVAVDDTHVAASTSQVDVTVKFKNGNATIAATAATVGNTVEVTVGSKTYTVTLTAATTSASGTKIAFGTGTGANRLSEEAFAAALNTAVNTQIEAANKTAASSAAASDTYTTIGTVNVTWTGDSFAGGTVTTSTMKPTYEKGEVNTVSSKAVTVSATGVDWTDSSNQVGDLEGETVTVDINGKEYTVTITTATVAASAVGEGTVQVKATASGTAALAAIQTELAAMVQKDVDAAKEGNNSYTNIENITLTGADDGTITAGYKATEMKSNDPAADQPDDNTSDGAAPTIDYNLTVGGLNFTLKLGVGTHSGADVAKMLAEKLNKGEYSTEAAGNTGSTPATAENAGIALAVEGDTADGGEGTEAAGGKTLADLVAFTASVVGSTLTITMDEAPKSKWDVDMTLKFDDDGNGGPIANGGEQFKPTVEVEPIDSTVQREYAQAIIDLNDPTLGIKDGFSLQLGNTTYTFAIGSDSRFKNSDNVVDLTDMTQTQFDSPVDETKAAAIARAADRLSKAAAANSTFYVGSDTKGGISLTEKEGAIDYSVNNLAGEDGKGTSGQGDGVLGGTDAGDAGNTNFDSKLGDWKGLVKIGQASVTGNGLTLQIGDTSDEYNQLTVSIGDIHTKALGIDSIDISTQSGAQKAIDNIKTAINTVSSIRGTLGATQNRLEHTANNLSVMAENIQDAESTIRDTDIAEEMMAYTKNNILVQSAQAMLAQANQIPQGVLQLLG